MANPKQLAILNQGIGIWNKWREKNPDVEIDFCNARLFGTNLNGANFRKVNLTGARLFNAEFFKADLSEANLHGADLGQAILKEANLTRIDLRNTNLFKVDFTKALLREANLEEARLEKADLSDADCSGANFCKANLNAVQALSTNFQNAIFTGACLHDWNINRLTNLNGAICNYVYLREHWNFNDDGDVIEYSWCNRLPHDVHRNFVPGEFSRLFQQTLETVNLIFNDGIDWRAFLASFKKLQVEVGSAKLTIQAIEKKQDGTFVVKVDVSSDANKAIIERSFYHNYEQKLQRLTATYRTQLQAQEREIAIYKRHNATMENIVTMLANNQPIEVNNMVSGGDSYHQREMGIGHMSGGEIKDSATVAGVYNEAQQKDLAEAAAEIQQLLTQLEQGYPTETVSQQVDVANKALKQIEQNPTLMRKLLNAGEAGGLAALEKALDNPVGAFLTEFLKAILEAEKKS